MFDDEVLDGVSLPISKTLFDEIMECEVDAADLDSLLPSQQQFYQAMLSATFSTGSAVLTMTEDGLVYFLNVLLPTNMEMWSTWGTPYGATLIRHSRLILQEFDAYCPY